MPDGFFKAVLRKDGRKYKAIAFLFENDGRKQTLQDVVVSVNDVEALTGFNLFTNLRDYIEEKVESQADLEEWK